MGIRCRSRAYVKKATLLQIATMRSGTLRFMQNIIRTREEAA